MTAMSVTSPFSPVIVYCLLRSRISSGTILKQAYKKANSPTKAPNQSSIDSC